MNFMGQPTPRGVKPSLVVVLVLVALAVGFVMGGAANRWVHDRDIVLGQCVPVHGMECLKAMNKK
jgi:hypothetical protein